MRNVGFKARCPVIHRTSAVQVMDRVFLLCLVKVKKTLQKPCTNNLAQRRIKEDRDQSK